MSLFSITGRIGKDAELRTTGGGTKVVSFSVAEDRGFGDKKRTIWVKAAMFGERAEKVHPYLTKGTMIEAWGEISASAYEGKDGNPQASLELRVSELKLHGGGQKRDEPVMDRGQASRYNLDDDIPF